MLSVVPIDETISWGGFLVIFKVEGEVVEG